MSQAIGEALRDEAHRKLMTSFELQDWQLAGNEDRDGLAFAEPSRKMRIEVEADRINIYHGEKPELVLWIELNGGSLFVHAYDHQHDEPTSLHIQADSITVSEPE